MVRGFGSASKSYFLTAENGKVIFMFNTRDLFASWVFPTWYLFYFQAALTIDILSTYRAFMKCLKTNRHSVQYCLEEYLAKWHYLVYIVVLPLSACSSCYAMYAKYNGEQYIY